MTDNWTARLSEYLDETLAPTERQALAAHLTGCAECTATLAELRRVVARAESIEDRPPPRSGAAAGAGRRQRPGKGGHPPGPGRGAEPRADGPGHRAGGPGAGEGPGQRVPEPPPPGNEGGQPQPLASGGRHLAADLG